MARFTKILRTKAMRQLTSSKKVQDQVYRRSKEIFDRSKKQMLDDFANHPVTKEIEAGPDSSNISGTIIGGGNLFSFIGFHAGDNPIRNVYNLLNMGTYLSGKKPRVVRKTKDRVYLGFRVVSPTVSQLASQTRMPWEPGSWLFKIEQGISGLGYYIYQKGIKASRSGTGIQADGKVKQAVFKRVSYMSAILNTFKRNFAK